MNNNPCDICTHPTDCFECVFGLSKPIVECQESRCIYHHDCGCLLAFDEVCRASTCYKVDEDEMEDKKDETE